MTSLNAWFPSLLTFCIPASALLAPQPSLLRPMRHVLTIQEQIVKESTRQGVSAHLTLATALRESGFNAEAVHYNRTSEDRGVFQLNSRYYPPMSMEENLKAGVAAVAKAHQCGSDVEARWAYVHGHCSNQYREKR